MPRIVPLVLLLVFAPVTASCEVESVVIDSALTPEQAIRQNQPPGTPEDVLAQLVLIDVRYWGFDDRLHQGQIVAHRALRRDVQRIFAKIEQKRFPLESVLPIAHPLIQLKGPYGLSPDTNNTSGYAWRPMTGAQSVSLHALGLAIDLNPRLNPYIKGETVIPAGSVYDTSRPGTLAPKSRIVRYFKQRGWTWGGDWKSQRDYMHFQKIPKSLEAWVKGYRK